MDYSRMRLITGCILPAVSSVATAVLVFIFLWSDETDFGVLTIGAPLLSGLAAAILVMAVLTPLNKWLMKQALIEGADKDCLAAWKSENRPTWS